MNGTKPSEKDPKICVPLSNCDLINCTGKNEICTTQDIKGILRSFCTCKNGTVRNIKTKICQPVPGEATEVLQYCTNDNYCKNVNNSYCNPKTSRCECKPGYSIQGPICVQIIPPPPVSPAICTAYGDPHFRTFDGLNYDNQVVGDILLAKDSVLTVQAQTSPCQGLPSVSCVDALALKYQNEDVIIIYKNLTAFVNGNQISNFPATSQSGTIIRQVPVIGVNFTNYFARIFVGIAEVTFPGKFFLKMLDLLGTSFNNTSGMCGNFDLIAENDSNKTFLAPTSYFPSQKRGLLNTEQQIDSQTFIISPNCELEASATNETSADPPPHKCTELLEIESLFPGCSNYVDATPYYDSCVFDYCFVGNEAYNYSYYALEGSFLIFHF